METRLKEIKLEYNSEQRKVGGYINVVERESEVLYSRSRNKWFKETMKAGVFTRALQKNDAIPLLLEHDWAKELAHTANGTLELKEDAIGLRFDAVVSENTFEEMKKRNISACSFGFRANEEIFEEVNPKLEKRYVTNIDLFEVSLVANPAYSGSIVEQRNMEEALKEIESTDEEVANEEIQVEETHTQEDVEEVRDEVSNTIVAENNENEVDIESTNSKDSGTIEETVSEERTVDIDTTSSEIKNEAKEVLQDVIEKTTNDAELYGELAKDVDEYKEIVEQEHEETINALEDESLYYTTQAYLKWLEVAKLKHIQINL